MFEYLEGEITLIGPGYIVVDCGGTGYKLFCANPYSYQKGQKARVFCEQIVRDTGIKLYGFNSGRAKKLFLKLISVNGIGPKSALAIMATDDIRSLAAAIANGEVKYLTKFPGIGKKTASQIVFDLKGKLKEFTSESQTEAKPVKDVDSPALDDALQALQALGYTKRDIERIKPGLQKLELKSASDYTKKGLSLLLKK